VSLDWQPPTLETSRLRLRPLTPDDAASIFLYACNPNMTRYTLWDTHQSINDTLWFVQDYAHSRYSNQEPDPLGIVMKNDADALVIGSIGCFWSNKANEVMELGYSLAEPYWGRGIIAEASRPLIDFVFREYAVTRLQARVFVGNAGSERVLQKLGFTREGVLRSAQQLRGRTLDVAMYSLLRSEWERTTWFA
jgi:ribosomal-protein-alanine N-acetyltransferase